MDLSINQVISKVYLWLCLGLGITFGTGFLLQNSELAAKFLTGYNYMILVVIEIAFALVLSTRIYKMKPTTCKFLYLLYTAITGITFSSIFMTYQLSSIIYIFGITAIILMVFGFIGYKTNIDLTKIGTFLFIGLIGVVILWIVSFFVSSVAINLLTCILALVVFIGYMAYDMQMIKRLVNTMDYDKVAVYGAFQLYLDFINVFIHLLQLFGRRD